MAGTAVYGVVASALGPRMPRHVMIAWLWLRLAALCAVVYGVIVSAERVQSPAVLAIIIICTVLAAAAWLGWLVSVALNHHRRVLTISTALLVIMGGVLGGTINPPGPALVLCGAGMLLAAITLQPASAIGLCSIGVVALGSCSLVLGHRPETVAGYAAVLMAVTLGGFNRRQYLARLRQAELLVAQTRQTQAEHARTAALSERARIAREIHDVLAHSLGALTMQLDAADALLAAGQDVKRVHGHVTRARNLAAEGLTEARRAVQALRTEVHPLPAQLATLCESHQTDTGTSTTLTVTGKHRRLPAEAELTAYRTAQEALSNASKHAASAPVSVELGYSAEEVALTISNRAATSSTQAPGRLAGSGGGYGLAGLAERAALVGGTLSAGPDNGGWEVHLCLPT